MSLSIAYASRINYTYDMAIIKVYRNGSLSLAEHSEDIQQRWAPYDDAKPANRSGRLNSLYASPSIAGVVRWVKGNHLVSGSDPKADLTNHEIIVSNPEQVFVYSIDAYDKTTRFDGASTKGVEKYWESGIPLSEWESKSAELNLDPTEWEVLLPVESIKSSKVVSNARILNAASDFDKEQLKAEFKRRSRFA